jgi:hypothetical protein
MRGTELSLYSVCAEQRLTYTHYKLNAFEKRSSIIWKKGLEFELILNVRETMFRLYCTSFGASLAILYMERAVAQQLASKNTKCLIYP